jgi:pimeloyl-ACP methyl ester carboxylesterase
MSAEEIFETIAGCRTRVMRKGTGSPLLFLHGAAGSTQWVPFFDKLAETHTVYAPEHPGYGGSDNPPWLDNIHDLAYFYLDFIDHFGLKNLDLVGTSLGGWLGCEIAVRHQTPLRSLTLVAPAGLRVPGLRKADIFMLSPQDTVRHLFHDEKLVEQALAQVPTEQQVDIMLKNRLTTAKVGWEPRLYDPNLHKWLHRITVPTQVVWGRQDRIISEGYGKAFTDLIPGSQLRLIEDCGHVPHIEKAGELAGIIDSFVRGI